MHIRTERQIVVDRSDVNKESMFSLAQKSAQNGAKQQN